MHLLGIALTFASQTSSKPDPAVTKAELEADVRFLASDELQGRSTGSPEAEKAAAWLAAELARAGIEPAGDGGTFLQAVPLHRMEAKSSPELRLWTASGDKAAPFIAAVGRDYESVSTPVDLQDLEIVVAKTEAEIPRKADPRKAILVDAFSLDAKRWLEAAGHAGGSGFGLWIQGGSKTPGEERVFKAGPVSGLARDADDARPSALAIRVRGPLLDRLKKGEFARLSLASHVERVPVRASNVLGKIPGAGLPGKPEIAKEAIVVSAHYDHLPPSRSENEKDKIFNGADDDASGCAAVLEIAGALAAGPKPARTVVILLATGEEEGLLGTDVYIEHPAVPLAATVANLNVEMIGRPDPLIGGAGQVWLTGFDKTDLGSTCAAKGIQLKPDPRLDQHFYERSDNFAFVMKKVVGQSFSTYNLHADYHRPSDEAATLDYAHMETATKTILEAVRLCADGSYRPGWTEESRAKPR